MKNDLDDIKLLEKFLVNNKDLEALESLIAKFNIFEAVGAIRQELRHSDFLSFLLNPNENHGLHELFLKRLLQKGSMISDEVNINAIEIDTADYSVVDIRREWNNIDILISIPSIPIICTIENKIFTGEHSDQLSRYKNLVEIEFPKSKHLFIYLTPDGIAPSDEEWLPLSYNDIAEILKNTTESMSSSLGNDILTLIKHYIAMLERHIISDSHIAELCRKIYSTHKKAIDLIIEHRPDVQLDIKDYLEKIIKDVKEPAIIMDHCSKSYIRFAPKEWEKLKFQKTGEGWTRTHRVLLFQFQNYEDSLSLKLFIGPGDTEARKKIFDAVQDNKKVFKGTIKKLSEKWSQIYKYDIIKKNDYEDITSSEIFRKITDRWIKFINDDLITITKIVSEIKF